MSDTNRTSEQNIERPHKGAAAISVFLCSDSSCWCWAEDRAKREQASRPSKQQLDNANVLWQEVARQLKAGIGVPSITLNRVHWLSAIEEVERLREERRVADETSARDILQCLVDTCELATSAPWPALDEARAFLSGSPEEPEEPRGVRTYTALNYVGNGPLPDCDECYKPYSAHGEMDECPPVKATRPLPDHLKAPVKVDDPCPAFDVTLHEEHQGKCVYCGAPMAQENSEEPTRQLSPSEAASFAKTLARSPRRVPLRDSDAAFNLGVLPTEQPEKA